MERFVKGRPINGYEDIFPENGDLLKYLAFGKLALTKGQTFEAATKDFETTLVILNGKLSVSSEGKEWTHLGGRQNVFDGKATAIYIPCHSSYKVTAETDTKVAVCKVKAEEKYEPFVVGPEHIVVNERGDETWKRVVHNIIEDNDFPGKVQRTVLGETFNAPGNWSGYPPHKHDGEFAPEEPDLEEIYHYQVNPEQGFGVQFLYTKDGELDEAYTIRPGASFAIDKGYHPVGSAGGYQVYYLWFMAGPTGRKLNPYEDPDHRWLNK
ncbi:5-deoxy-glucuronate isomerase [Pullulanibacillus pueri]|uniref:5-deoxy-glucuronate isomerase n=1 Tax=Pullulanibacillus pueri TaxID=1437324 RepID=A0A8J3EN95_9BACL|nr:5-deoxy-glucuronate isomerase [Pullulanibacillus pueri]MBM7682992.1 5-deoxy-glucuronate isomerase [Pullulanibacillus pueri]GGH85931.1 5-deoxy-glucuronate isomerase [Pullulanibacillus pueri]